jgi:Tfp pilus assembly protein PilF
MIDILVLTLGLLSPSIHAQQVGTASEHFRNGMLALTSEQYEKAEREFRRAVELDPLYDAAFYGLGQVHMATRNYPQAVKAYLDARNAFEAGQAADKLDAVAADRRLRDQLQASKDYGRTLQRMSATNSPGLAAAIERNREEQRQLEARLSRAKGAPPLPVPAGLSMALGSAYFRTGDLENAERAYVDAVKTDPGFGEAHSNLAVLYLQTGRYREADDEVRAAEKAGYKVHPQLKQDIKARLK